MVQADIERSDSTEKFNVRSEWLPIESAPKDGTAVLIAGGTYWNDSETFETVYPFLQVTIARHYKGQDEWNGGYGSEYDAVYWHNPTHWQPLPSPPGAELNFSNDAGSDAVSLNQSLSKEKE